MWNNYNNKLLNNNYISKKKKHYTRIKLYKILINYYYYKHLNKNIDIAKNDNLKQKIELELDKGVVILNHNKNDDEILKQDNCLDLDKMVVTCVDNNNLFDNTLNNEKVIQLLENIDIDNFIELMNINENLLNNNLNDNNNINDKMIKVFITKLFDNYI